MKFYEFSVNFLEKGTLRDSKTLTWSVGSNNFNFKDDNGSPYVEFNSLFDLKCTNRYGSIQIKNTMGKYFIQSNIFHGSIGLVDWEERSWSSDSVYAELSNFRVDVRESHFKQTL